MGDSVAELEQYPPRNCLLLHGVRELEGENTNDVTMKTIKEEIDIDIREEDLDEHIVLATQRFVKKVNQSP